MARRLIPTAEELMFAPGDLVHVNRFVDGEFEEFRDTISSIEILATDTKWSAYYYFENHDDEAKHFEIKLVSRGGVSNPVPEPKYDIGDVLKYVHHWDLRKQVCYDEVASLSVIWDSDECAVRYLPVRQSDVIYEDDVKGVYVPKNDQGDNRNTA